MEKYVKVEIYIPEENERDLMEVINDKGFIKEGLYDYAYSASIVRGHFRPLDGASPHIGNVGDVEEVVEIKIEFRIKSEDKEDLDRLIRSVHPYEVPVINYIGLI